MNELSFKKDIAPIFAQYRAQMIWRFDLTKYEDVVANSQTIYGRISASDPGSRMPPPPFSPLTKGQINLFENWMNQGFPE